MHITQKVTSDFTNVDVAESRLRLAVLRGQYDLLFHVPSNKSSRKPRKLRQTGIQSLQSVFNWLISDERSQVLSMDSWPNDRAELEALKSFYLRSGLLLEACMERPAIRDIVDVTRLARVETSRKLLETFRTRLWQLLRDQNVTLNLVREYLNAAKCVVVVQILRIMESYSIFDTEKSVLAELVTQLENVGEFLIDVQREIRAYRPMHSVANTLFDRERSQWNSLAEIHGVNGLLQYSLARVHRAQGGPHLESARQCLVRALVHYEDRTARESSLHDQSDELDETAVSFDTAHNAPLTRAERNELRSKQQEQLKVRRREKREQRRGHIISSSYRSSLVLAQQSYLSFIESKLADGDSTIKAARLLALVSGDNEVLLSEIELISLCIERSLLKPIKILNGDLEETARRTKILKGLREVESLSVAYNRLTYANMSLYQRAQCRSYKSDRLHQASRDAEQILANCEVLIADAEARKNEGKKSSKLSSIYWQVSANTLKLTLASRAARYEKKFDPNSLRKALTHGEVALHLAGNRPELNHLRVECSARMAEAFVLLGRTDEAEKHLANAVPESTNVGYTTQPFVTALRTLLEAEIALQLEEYPRAMGLISKFEQSSLPHVESEWLRDHHQHVLKKMIDTKGVLMVTASMLRADQEKTTGRKLTYTLLKERLQEFMYDVTATGKISDKDLAVKLGVNPKTAAQFRTSIAKRREAP